MKYLAPSLEAMLTAFQQFERRYRRPETIYRHDEVMQQAAKILRDIELSRERYVAISLSGRKELRDESAMRKHMEKLDRMLKYNQAPIFKWNLTNSFVRRRLKRDRALQRLAQWFGEHAETLEVSCC